MAAMDAARSSVRYRFAGFFVVSSTMRADFFDLTLMVEVCSRCAHIP